MLAGEALALTADPLVAARQVVGGARRPLGDRTPSLGVLFASPHFFNTAETLLSAVMEELGPIALVGCVAESVIAGSREIEAEPAVALWLAADLGQVETFAMEFVGTPAGGAYGGYQFGQQLGGAYLLICDPFTFPVQDLLTHLNADAAGTVIIGGLASGGMHARQNRLFLDGKVLHSGAVGVHLAETEIHAVVSQGCRPIGSPLTITAAEGNVIRELGGRPPLSRLQDLARTLSIRDQQLLAHGLQIGKVINEYQADWRQGEFLIRGIVGVEPKSGALAIGDQVAVGQTVQFHVRDADSADQDLRSALESARAVIGHRRVAGALLFTCNGRGSRLFPAPDHDARLLQEVLGTTAMVGFFCAGELGPVGGQNFLHGFSASIALFPEAPSAA